MKVTFIGAGSTMFAKNLFGDLMLLPEIEGFTASLFDIDPVRLKESEDLVNRLAKLFGKKVKVEATTDRIRALTGADYVINGKEQDTVAEIKRLTEGKGCDLSIETAGTQITASQLIQASKKGATIVFVGYSASGEMTLPIGMALDKELTFKTVFRYRNIYPMAIEAIAAGKIRIKDIVTDYFELDDIQHAMDACVENKAEIVKGVIRI